MLVIAIEFFFLGLSQLEDDIVEFGILQRNRLMTMSFLPGIWYFFAASFSRGDIKGILKKRIWLLVPALLAPPLLAILGKDYLLFIDPNREDPTLMLGWIGYLTHLLMLMGSIGILVELEKTFKASVGTLRWKIKFTFFGLATLFSIRFFVSSQAILFQNIDSTMDTVVVVAFLVSSLLIGRSMMRPGSFDLELYPSRSVISGSLSIAIAGAYLIAVGASSKAVEFFGGEDGFTIKVSFILLAVIGLVLFLQSDRFRNSLRRFVSRHFQRPLYDYQNVWNQVTEATTESVDRASISDSAVRILSRLFDVKLVSIWLLNTEHTYFELAASSDRILSAEISRNRETVSLAKLVETLQNRGEPFDLDRDSDGTLDELKRANPSSFEHGGTRVCAPLIGRESVVGFIVIGDRVNASRFAQQEFDILRCVATHLAANLHIASLSLRLAQSKEIEAFQTMATFFVHDLKNAVSTLNLMLKNMPEHWDNPEFRQDALGSIKGTSDRISTLITKLGQVRREMEIRKCRISLSEIIDKAIEKWRPPDFIRTTKELEENLTIEADADKLHSVIMNLLINASEAINGKGNIYIKSRKINRHAEILVQDDGVGMSDDFILHKLFKPFKTTKETGLGIGMFQSKTIVEAHGGSISVESEEGRGSLFTIKIPFV